MHRERDTCISALTAVALVFRDAATITNNPHAQRRQVKLSRKAHKQSKAQAAIQAALEIAREHARLIEAAKHTKEIGREPADSELVSK